MQPNGRAQAVLDCLRAQGALFFEELAEASGLLRPQLEEALGELVSLGLVTSDSFGGLRALLVPSDRRKPFAGGTRRRRIMGFGMEDAGRWSLMRRPARDPRSPGLARPSTWRGHCCAATAWCSGDLLAREAEWLPPWRDLLRVYRRLEARGEIRGGRFVAGFSGEQYALPDAIGLLREVRRRPLSDAFVSLSGADPLNLVGILTPGAKLAAVTANRLLYRDGLPVASLAGGDVQFLTTLDAAAAMAGAQDVAAICIAGIARRSGVISTWRSRTRCRRWRKPSHGQPVICFTGNRSWRVYLPPIRPSVNSRRVEECGLSAAQVERVKDDFYHAREQTSCIDRVGSASISSRHLPPFSTCPVLHLSMRCGYSSWPRGISASRRLRAS